FTFTDLDCNDETQLGVSAVDTAGNESKISHTNARTVKCADRTKPTVEITSPGAGASIRNGRIVRADADDSESGVDSVAFRYCPGATCAWTAGQPIGT